MIKVAISKVDRFLRLQSIPALGHLFVFYLPAIVEVEDEAVQETLFRALRYGDSTGKATEAGRFRDLDQDTVDLMVEPFSLHDVGVSSGVTSLDLLKRLKGAEKEGVLTISDKFAEMAVSRGRVITRVYDGWSKLRCLYIFGIQCDPGLSWWFPISKLVFYPFAVLQDSAPKTRLLLLAGAVLKALHGHDVEYVRYDVFETRLDEKFTFVRCMNLLNLSYFSEDRILMGLRNMRNSLRQGGVLLVGRTIGEAKNAASFFRRQGELLISIRESHGGFEARHVVERLNDEERLRAGVSARG